ncbi:hypothetical protein F7725_027572, partial [Dissostichus mawsoni]
MQRPLFVFTGKCAIRSLRTSSGGCDLLDGAPFGGLPSPEDGLLSIQQALSVLGSRCLKMVVLSWRSQALITARMMVCQKMYTYQRLDFMGLVQQ